MLFMRPERALEKTVSYSEDRKGWRGKDAGLGSCSHGDLPYKRWERGFLSPKGGGPRFLADEGLENFLKGERGGHSLRSSTEAQTTQHETKLLTNLSERRGRTQEGQRAPCWCRDSHIKFAPERPEPPREGGEPGNSRRANGVFPAGKGGTGILDLFTVYVEKETWNSPAVWREWIESRFRCRG